MIMRLYKTLKSMKTSAQFLTGLVLSAVLLFSLSNTQAQQHRLRSGAQITPYKTTVIANGKDEISIRVVAIDPMGAEMKGANNLIKFSLQGDARITAIKPDNTTDADKKLGDTSAQAHLVNGILW